MNFYLIIVLFTMLLQPFLCRSSEERRMVKAKRQLRSTPDAQYTPTQCLGELQLFISNELSESLKLHKQAPAITIFLQKQEKLTQVELESNQPSASETVIKEEIKVENSPPKSKIDQKISKKLTPRNNAPIEFNPYAQILAHNIALFTQAQCSAERSALIAKASNAVRSKKHKLPNIEDEESALADLYQKHKINPPSRNNLKQKFLRDCKNKQYDFKIDITKNGCFCYVDTDTKDLQILVIDLSDETLNDQNTVMISSPLSSPGNPSRNAEIALSW